MGKQPKKLTRTEVMELAWRFIREGADLLNEYHGADLADMFAKLLVAEVPTRTVQWSAHDEVEAMRFAKDNVAKSRWFSAEPLPDGVWVFRVKNE